MERQIVFFAHNPAKRGPSRVVHRSFPFFSIIRIASLAFAMVVGVLKNADGWDQAVESVELEEFMRSTRVHTQQKRIKFLMDYSVELETRIQSEIGKNGLADVNLPKFGALECRGGGGEPGHADILETQNHLIQLYEDYCNALEQFYAHMLGHEQELRGQTP
jgi:hypothetical protein